MNKHNLAQSSLIAATLTTVFVTAITIAGELYKVTGADGKVINPIKEFLKALHGHHWVGKGIWALVLFAVTTVVMYLINRRNTSEHKLTCYISVLTYTVTGATLVLFGFFIFEFLSH